VVKPPFIMALIIVLTLINGALTQVALANQLTVTTNKGNYGPGDILEILGTATPETLISIQLLKPDGDLATVAQTVIDADGNYQVQIYTFTIYDPEGEWTVKVYEPTLNETAEARFTFSLKAGDLIPPKLTITLEPIKETYGEEQLTIIVTSNEQLWEPPRISVAQEGLEPVTILVEQADDLEWRAFYNVVEGYEGKATITAEGIDMAGNVGTVTLSFTVKLEEPASKPLVEQQETPETSMDLKEFESRIAALAQRVENLENALANMENRLSNIEEEIAKLKEDLSSLKALYYTQDQETQKLKSIAGELGDNVKTLGENVKEINEKTGKLEERILQAESQLKSLNTRLIEIDSKLSELLRAQQIPQMTATLAIAAIIISIATLVALRRALKPFKP
jgi:chaperonin cofactor prefoldin